MARTGITAWGRSIEVVANETHADGRKVLSGGVLCVNPHGIIPMHIHTECNEEYVIQSENVKVIVVSQVMAKALSDSNVYDLLRNAPVVAEGESSTCLRYEGHALMNDSDTEAHIVYIKYE